MCTLTSSMCTHPLVSVIVATYRQDISLRNALASLSQQTYPNIEILVVDDNCNSEWNNRVHHVLSLFSHLNIRYLQNKTNLGSAHTRNQGIFAASGEYITFLDDDDLYLPEKISHQLSAMLHTKADFSISNLDNYYDNGRLSNYTRRDYLLHARQSDLLRLHFMYHMTCPDTMMFRATYLHRIGGFGTVNLGDEFYLMSEAIQAGGRFCYVPESDVQTFVHLKETGLSNGLNKINGEMRLYEYKQPFFDRFDRKSCRCIRMRHYAVLAFGYARLKRPWAFFITCTKSFFCSPTSFIKLAIDKKGTRKP